MVRADCSIVLVLLAGSAHCDPQIAASNYGFRRLDVANLFGIVLFPELAS
jgi:hypothetical protein